MEVLKESHKPKSQIDGFMTFRYEDKNGNVFIIKPSNQFFKKRNREDVLSKSLMVFKTTEQVSHLLQHYLEGVNLKELSSSDTTIALMFFQDNIKYGLLINLSFQGNDNVYNITLITLEVEEDKHYLFGEMFRNCDHKIYLNEYILPISYYKKSNTVKYYISYNDIKCKAQLCYSPHFKKKVIENNLPFQGDECFYKMMFRGIKRALKTQVGFSDSLLDKTFENIIIKFSFQTRFYFVNMNIEKITLIDTKGKKEHTVQFIFHHFESSIVLSDISDNNFLCISLHSILNDIKQSNKARVKNNKIRQEVITKNKQILNKKTNKVKVINRVSEKRIPLRKVEHINSKTLYKNESQERLDYNKLHEASINENCFTDLDKYSLEVESIQSNLDY